MAQTITQPINWQTHGGRQFLYRRDGLFCALLMAACLLAARPFVEMGFIDDWSYIKTAQVFAQTGHFVYNGWATATLGWQVLWGALFSKLLGFSFVHVRLSTLPVAAASVYLFHQILIRFGMVRGYALFGALTLALSPVFLVMSASYMTDVPGLFCTLLCLYLCQRALAALTDRAALAWLALATVTNIAGGTVRQTVWLGALVMVPSTVWLLRRRRNLLRSGALLWLASVVGVFLCMRWFNHQPYFVPSSVPAERLTGAALKGTVVNEVIQEIKVFLCLLLLVFPILTAWWPLTRFVPRRPLLLLSVISMILLIGFLVYYRGHEGLNSWTAPWISNAIGSMGVDGRGDIPGIRPGPLHTWLRVVITMLVLGSALLFFLHLFSRLRRHTLVSQTHAPFWYQIFWLLAPFTLGYLGTLCIRGVADPVFDRYLLPLQAVGTVVLLRYYQDFAAQDRRQPPFTATANRLPAISYGALLAFAYFALAGTHDWFALSRARLEAAEQVRRSGVPRTAIQGGFEYDSWTQLQAGGYINEPRIRIPRDAFHPTSFSPDVPSECATWFPLTFTPVVRPRYFLVHSLVHCFAPTPFPAVTYHAWMPPFTRQIYVQQGKD